MHDLIIRGATLYDGSGAPGRRADVAVAAGAPPGGGARVLLSSPEPQ